MIYLVILAIAIPFALQLKQALQRTKYLAAEQAKDSCTRIQRTSKLDPNHSLLESHKIMVSTVEQMLNAKNRTAAQLLNKLADRFSNQAELWRFHRMRNQAAHELDFYVSANDAKEARKVFKKTLQDLVKQK
ncbi:MAG: hypothetical protein OXU45_02730 [Candidatus Melainabacteria bacterium]|nr:hypothetical protein [Candidatus Melainabacteria bacterium]